MKYMCYFYKYIRAFGYREQKLLLLSGNLSFLNKCIVWVMVFSSQKLEPSELFFRLDQ